MAGDGAIERAALDYARRGWSVVPLAPRDKKPLVMWSEYQQRRAAAAEISDWFGRWPLANVGVVTGAISGLVVLDVDPRHGGDGSLLALERTHGGLPETVEALTGGGGRHLYLRHPGGTVRNMVGIAAGIDLRGDGGLIVAPPSVHPSGRSYVWEVSCHPDDTPLAGMPAWLLALSLHHADHPGHPMSHWRALVRDGVPEGQRNNTIASLAGHLLRHGVDREVVQELLMCWSRFRCRPPLDADEVARTVESIHRLHFREDRE